MPLDRRSFLSAATSLAATAALGTATSSAPARSPAAGRGDPLGVRDDFPITASRNYLNSAYIAPIPKAVLAAGQGFMEMRALQPLDVGDLLRTVGATRTRFARFLNASPDEVALLYTTTEGENIVANSITWAAGDNVVRLLPPLNATDEDIAEAASRLSRALSRLQGRSS